jgi:hypothetical protein
VQLTAVPADWQVRSVAYQRDGRFLRATEYQVAHPGADPDLGSGGVTAYEVPFLSAAPAGAHSSCFSPVTGSTSRRRVIDGYRVVVYTYQGYQQLCAASADGLKVTIAEVGRHPALTVASIFANHLRLLGRNPANWTTQPIRR